MRFHILLFSITLAGINGACKSSAPSAQVQNTETKFLYSKDALSQHSHRLVIFRPPALNFDPSQAFVRTPSGSFALAGNSALNLSPEELDYLSAKLMGQFQSYFAELASRNDHLVDQVFKSLLAARLAASEVYTPKIVQSLENRTWTMAILPNAQAFHHYFSNSPLNMGPDQDQLSNVHFSSEDPLAIYTSTISHIKEQVQRFQASGSTNPYFIAAIFGLRSRDQQVYLDSRIIAGLPPQEVCVAQDSNGECVDIEQEGTKVKRIVVPAENNPDRQPLVYINSSFPLLTDTHQDNWLEIAKDIQLNLAFGNLGSYNPTDHMFSPYHPFLNASLSIPYVIAEKPLVGKIKDLRLTFTEFKIDPIKGNIKDLSGHVTVFGLDTKLFFPVSLDTIAWFEEKTQTPPTKGKITDELNNFIEAQKTQLKTHINSEVEKNKILSMLISEILKPAKI